jgi:hypothetical protein
VSQLPFGISLLAAAASDLLSPVFIWQRNIGGFIADITVEEHHRDDLVVTENPVEQGADITDHAFKQPARLTVRVGYSNSSQNSGGDPGYVNDIYAQFLDMQANLQPINVTTGKRQYTNMLITSLETSTDERWENAMILVVELKQIILVNTQTVSVPSSQVMTAPGITGAPQNLGTNNLTPGTAANQASATPLLTTP